MPLNDVPATEVYTVAQVAYLLSLTTATVYGLLRQGEIPSLRLGRR